MKKIVVLTLCVLCLFLLCSCKSGSDKNESSAPADENATFQIKTSVVTLVYPQKWENKLNIEVTKDTVKFVNKETPIFDIVFKECDGYLLGTYKKTPVYIVEHPVYNDEQALMVEDVNVILQNLMKDENFEINK